MFFFFSLYSASFSISCVTGSPLWQSLRLRALCAPTMSIADGRFNYYACECVCQPHISAWCGRCLQKPTGVVIFCILMPAVDCQNRSRRPSALKPPQTERKCRVADDVTPQDEERMDTHIGVKISKTTVVRKNSVSDIFLMRPSAILQWRLLQRPAADVTTNCAFHQGCITVSFLCFALYYDRGSLINTYYTLMQNERQQKVSGAWTGTSALVN